MLQSLTDLNLMTLLLDAYDYTLVFEALTSIKRRSRTTPSCISQDMSQTLVHLVLCQDTMSWHPPPAAPLLVDTSRSRVGSGTREESSCAPSCGRRNSQLSCR